MHGSCPQKHVQSTKFDGSLSTRPEENFRPRLFGEVAKIVWAKPDTVIATIAGVSDRAARDYLNGKVPTPSVVLVALMHEIVKRN